MRLSLLAQQIKNYKKNYPLSLQCFVVGVDNIV